MTTTPQLPDAALSILASDLPDNSTANFVAAILLIVVIAAALLYYLSPMRLARGLVVAIAATEKTYLEGLETGLLSLSDVHIAEMLSTWVDPLPSPMYLFDMSIDSSSKSPPFAKGPSATPCLLVQPSANSVQRQPRSDDDIGAHVLFSTVGKFGGSRWLIQHFG
jgi:hypothetical protein